MRLSQKIRDFKECSSDLQSLPREQTALESELHEFELNLHKYESATDSIESKSTSASSTSSRKENKRCHDYKEIQDFHALIAKTGTFIFTGALIIKARWKMLFMKVIPYFVTRNIYVKSPN